MSSSVAAVLRHTHHTLATLTRPKIPKDVHTECMLDADSKGK